jgi:arsenate reductase
MSRPLRILFLCDGNSCRSQMAEAWTRVLHPGRFEPFSAGTNPGRLDPRAVRVMAESGVDMSKQRSKYVDDLAGIPIDWAITVCDMAKEACPVYPGGARQAHAGFDDPPRLAGARPTRRQRSYPTGACGTRSGLTSKNFHSSSPSQ